MTQQPPPTIGIAAQADERATWLKAQHDAFVRAGFSSEQADYFCSALCTGRES